MSGPLSLRGTFHHAVGAALVLANSSMMNIPNGAVLAGKDSVAKNFKLIKMMAVMVVEVKCTKQKEYTFYLFYQQKMFKSPSF
jgi:hypothetical protein